MDLFPDPLPVLPLDGLRSPLPLGEPFTPAMAARAGVGRAELERLHREGRILRVLRGVYLDAAVAVDTAVRARSVALLLGRHQVVVGRTAAWIHGALPPTAAGAVEVDRHRRRPGQRSRWRTCDLSVIGGLRCTSPLRTAVDVGRLLPPDRALPLLDGLLRIGAVTHQELLRASIDPRYLRWTGIVQLRELAALADGRSGDGAESVLRLRWLDANLPTPTPAVEVDGIRLALGLAPQRFGAALSGQVTPSELGRCGEVGWQVLVLPGSRVLGSDPRHLGEHLEREFHQHLLRQVG